MLDQAHPLPRQAVTRRPRDPRLDFFRGLGMFIILIAHIPESNWLNWIPARFGFSDAADMFVFCSGMASALAFAGIFTTRGWLMGTARILHRMWQVYWVHIGSFFVVAAICFAADNLFATGGRYAQIFTFDKALADAPQRVLQLMTLRYIPELFFDILPMYLALLAMIPVIMALARVHVALVFAFMCASWLAANQFGFNLRAQPEGGRDWYFNPFAWQVVFFSGFALVRGWWPAPPRDWRLLAVCIAYVALASLVSCQEGYYCHAGFGTSQTLGNIHAALVPWVDKTSQGILRYLHFMATVYIAWYLAGEHGRNLTGPIVELIRRVGTQTLAVFVTSLIAAPILGIILLQAGANFFTVAVANIAGMLMLIAGGRLTGWFKSSPWRIKGAGASEG